MEIGVEAALFPEKDYINGIAVAVWTMDATIPSVLLKKNFLVIKQSQLFWAQMALAALVPFKGPKKSRFLGPPPPPKMPLVMDSPPLNTTSYRPI